MFTCCMTTFYICAEAKLMDSLRHNSWIYNHIPAWEMTKVIFASLTAI